MYLKQKKEETNMRILLCCAGGFSTNMLMQNMKKVVKESAKLNEEDFKFTAIPADSLEEEIDNWDVVLVGPQVSHKKIGRASCRERV